MSLPKSTTVSWSIGGTMVSVSVIRLYALCWKPQRRYNSYLTTSTEPKFEVPCFRNNPLSLACCYGCLNIQLILSPQWASLECTRSLEGIHSGQLIWDEQRDMSYHMISCSATKAAGKEEKGGYSWLWCLSTQVTVMHDRALLSRKLWNICPPMGISEWIPYFASVHSFCSTHSTVFIWIHEFSAFVLPTLLLTPLSEWVSSRVAA